MILCVSYPGRRGTKDQVRRPNQPMRDEETASLEDASGAPVRAKTDWKVALSVVLIGFGVFAVSGLHNPLAQVFYGTAAVTNRRGAVRGTTIDASAEEVQAELTTHYTVKELTTQYTVKGELQDIAVPVDPSKDEEDTEDTEVVEEERATLWSVRQKVAAAAAAKQNEDVKQEEEEKEEGEEPKPDPQPEPQPEPQPKPKPKPKLKQKPIFTLHPVYKQQLDMYTKFLNTAFPAGAADAAKQTHGSCKLCVDVVIGWSGPPDPGSGQGSSIRHRDNGEIIFLLRSIALNAPYVHHIFILVNTAQMAAPSVVNPDWIPRSIRDKTSIIDRCKHMPTGSCPTKNSMSVQTFAHHIPNLMEHYIIAEVGGLLS